ncbi:uncharacterized protein LOC131438283 isoform X2 [Malaya genurostris]|uniref:uncharacterized protein LOC131438283 isoform X2 n=1 Tax=Malaya genurostris TaxID=325434 RepID=UPI0026F398D1|nr:uncharacterized protein LOC131438283 isoform X2 [Malaya genurostris]
MNSTVKMISLLCFVKIILDTKICALLLLLNTVLAPISVAARYKPTITVAQDDTIIFANDEPEVILKVKNVNAGYKERNLPSAPKLVCIGSDIDNLRQKYLVIYDNLRYELSSAARATDVLIKLTAVLNLPYSKLSKLVWHFLSGVVYKIPQRESYAAIDQIRRFLDANSSTTNCSPP